MGFYNFQVVERSWGKKKKEEKIGREGGREEKDGLLVFMDKREQNKERKEDKGRY